MAVILSQPPIPKPQKTTVTLNPLQAVAQGYAADGLSLISVLPGRKDPALDEWKTFQFEAPSDRQRNAMFSAPGLNIAVVCGSVSGNYMEIDAETPQSFDLQYELLHRAGLTGTRIVRGPSGGGHFAFRLPYPVRTRGKVADVEILSEGRISLLPPSIAASKTDGALYPYQFANQAQILSVESVDQFHWLNLEPASLQTQFRAFPRKAQRLLKGEWNRQRYASRSEVEQAIIASLVGAAFSFESIVSAFRRYPAAGKFASINQADSHAALEWLRLSWNKARDFCANTSPARNNALELFNYAQSIPWRTRTGSSMRAVFIAHCGLSYRSGRRTYHASVRDVAELSGCDKSTASAATRRLCASNALRLVQRNAYTFACKYELPLFADIDTSTFTKEKKYQKEKIECGFQSNTLKPADPENRRIFGHSINQVCVGVSAVPSFLTPEAFRRRGLGLTSFEVLQALHAGPLSAPQIAAVTGRHVQTVRAALVYKLKPRGLVAKTGKLWRGRALEDIDLDELARKVSIKGAAAAQKDRHKADRLRHKIRLRVNQQHAQKAHEEA